MTPVHAQDAGDTVGMTQADKPAEDVFAFHGQATYIWQRKPSIGAAYSGEHSLGTERAKSYSFTSTLDLGLRLWQGAEFHFNPEVSQGVPFSGLHGLGGLSNGELAKSSGTNPTFYRARALSARRGASVAGRRSSMPTSTSSRGLWTSSASC